MKKLGVQVVLASHWGEGGKGAAELARIVVGLCDQPSKPTFVYEDADTLWDKINKIAKKVYRASEVTADAKVRALIKKLQDDGYGHYPGVRGEDPVLVFDRRLGARGARRTTW